MSPAISLESRSDSCTLMLAVKPATDCLDAATRSYSAFTASCLPMFNEMRKTARRGAAATWRDAFRPVLVVLCGHRATPRQPKIIAEARAEFRTGVHFVSGWNLGEGQPTAHRPLSAVVDTTHGH